MDYHISMTLGHYANKYACICSSFIDINMIHGAYGVIVAQELVELLDSERNRIGTQFI